MKNKVLQNIELNKEEINSYNINFDNVNKPKHYTDGKYECIDVMLETQGKESTMSFCLCNAFKYLYRHNKKNGSEDIHKAQWYINKYIELETLE